MKIMNNNDTITIFVDDKDENKLGIKFENKQNNFISIKKINLLILMNMKLKFHQQNLTQLLTFLHHF